MHALLKTTKQIPIQNSQQREDMEPYLIANPVLSQQLKRSLLYSHRNNFDHQLGGLKSAVKFLDRDSVEYAIFQASMGNETEAKMARKTLDHSLGLIDPVWGGVYQYSTQGWDSPHHSKTMSNQAGYLRIYALAYALWKDENYLNAANKIRDYLDRFLLSKHGSFYSGQSDTCKDCRPEEYFSLNHVARLDKGIPPVCKNIFTRENGWAIEALASLYEFSGDTTALTMALNAVHWIIKYRSYPDGGFLHDKDDDNGPYLSDSLAMARAMLQLFKVTQQDKWLIRAINAADFMSIYFKRRGGGFKSHVERLGFQSTEPQIDENIALMRFCNLLAHYSGLKRHREMAKHCLRYLCIDEIATAREDEVGILLANHEYLEHPVQITVFGSKQNEKAKDLFHTGLRHYGWFKVIHQYQSLRLRPLGSINAPSERPAAFVHDGSYESEAIRNPDKLKHILEQLS